MKLEVLKCLKSLEVDFTEAATIDIKDIKAQYLKLA